MCTVVSVVVAFVVVTVVTLSIACAVCPGKRRYDRKQEGYGGQTKPVFHKKAKTTKKIVLRLECKDCKQKFQVPPQFVFRWMAHAQSVSAGVVPWSDVLCLLCICVGRLP